MKSNDSPNEPAATPPDPLPGHPPIKPVTPPRGRWREALLSAGPAAVVLCVALIGALLYGAWVVLDPTPVRHIVMATGPEQGAYGEFAKRYVPLLQARGVSVELRPSRGTPDNLALLRDANSGVQVAFVQGGVQPREAGPRPQLLSLGSVAYEPLWLFYRADSARRLHGKDTPVENLSQLQRWRINVGPAGGGSAPLFRQLVEANHLQPGAMVLGDKPAVFGVVDLVQGATDALVTVSAADAPLVQYLLHTPGVLLFDFTQAEAYARRFAFLRPLTLPRGVVDLAADAPPRDVHLVAATASLVVRADLHPALQQLLLQAARQVHGEAGWFGRGDEFPNATAGELPLSPEAERFYREGPPWLQRYLPFWLASFVDRMWIVLLPLLAALLPLSRIVPPLVQLRVRSRVYRWYANLRAMEQALEQPGADLHRLGGELERLDAQTERIGVPLAYTNELYELRSHIHLVRRRLQARAGSGPSPA